MGSKHKHKKHKSERREKYEDRPFCLDRPPSLKLILKVGGSGGGNSSTPEYGSSESSSVYGVQPENLGLSIDYPERHKKSKKKKKKKEKKHKHHKEKRRNRDDSIERDENAENSRRNECDETSQDDFTVNDDSSQFHAKFGTTMDGQSPASATSIRPPLLSIKSPDLTESFTPQSILTSEQSPSMCSVRSDSMKSPSSMSDASGREPRTCVLKLKQSNSPLSKMLSHLLRLLEKKDPHQFFAWPVTDEIAPGYSSIISHPMDFLTIRQKVEENQYTSLQEFADDFRLMCENAIKYNHAETVYHKAARKLLHNGVKMLQPENLMRTLRPMQHYVQELSQAELGFEVGQNALHDGDNTAIDSADEGLSMGADEVAPSEEEEKRRNLRLQNEPKSRFEPFIDSLTPEEILAQVQSAADKVKKQTMSSRKRAAKMGFLRQRSDGTTSMEILVDADNSCPERVVSLGDFIGKLKQGTGRLQGFRKDRRNNVKVVKPLNYGTFCSFAPIYDSRFANLSKEDSELVLNTYGDETASEYAASVIEYTKDSQDASVLADSLLDMLTKGEHSKTMAMLIENSRQKYELSEVERTLPNTTADEDKKYENVPIDFDNLRSLADLGIDVSYLDELEKDVEVIQLFKKIEGKLGNNAALIERLNQVQNERLSQPLPPHLAQIPHPNEDEIDLAQQITSNLTEMAKQLPPKAIVSPHALRKAMGMSNVGLESIASNQRPSVSIVNGINASNNTISHGKTLENGKLTSMTNANETNVCVDINTTPVPMEIEPELTPSSQRPSNAPLSTASSNASTVNATTANALPQPSQSTPSSMSTPPSSMIIPSGPVDIEHELREFLEGSSESLTTTDDVGGIEQMLLD